MLFFAVVRTFGVLWFQAEYVQSSLPVWIQHVLMDVFWVIDGMLILSTLTKYKWWKYLIILSLFRLFYFAGHYPALYFLIEVSIVVLAAALYVKGRAKIA
jgi:hypothetical protein